METVIKFLYFVFSNTQTSSILNIIITISILFFLYWSYSIYRAILNANNIMPNIIKNIQKPSGRKGTRKLKKLKLISNIKNSPNLLKF
jgi:hypothetical protein